MSNNQKINVTKTFLPPQEEYQSILKLAWDNAWLTNRGVLVKELEDKLVDFLGVKFLTLTTNGTLPIQIAIKALELKGEIITTPFSYVATTSAIIWENCKPVFVDIDPEYWTIDETKIEEAITDRTSAILATHVFGNPCNVEVIEAIAKKHNLKVIYDAAHCFGVTYKGQSLFNYGDVSTCSFHSTKIFHTGEGGCWITKNDELQHRLYYHHNFGHNGPEAFHGLGINAKMSEMQAALGLTLLNYFDEILDGRKRVVNIYESLLRDSKLTLLRIRRGTEWNYHYFPVVFETVKDLLRVESKLQDSNIYPRRYFYPSLNQIKELVNYVQMPNSESISSRILCLPLHSNLSEIEIKKVVYCIKDIL